MVQSESQEQKNKGKFIDDWDEVKQEYKSDEAQTEQEAVVSNTTKVLEKNEAKTEELEKYQDPNEVNPMDYYKYKRQSMAQDIEQGEKDRLQREKEQQKEQKEQQEKEGEQGQGSQNEQSSGEQQPETTAQIPKSAVDELDSSSDPNKKIFHSVAQEQVDENQKDEASVFDYMNIIKQDANKLQHKIEDDSSTSNSSNDASKETHASDKGLDKPMIDETQKELE